MKTANDFYIILYAKYPWLEKLVCDMSLAITVVGGASRRFIERGELCSDIDIEVRFPGRGKEEFDELWQSFQKQLSQYCGHEPKSLEFNIFRIELPDAQLEFSPVRVESYNDSKSHKNFVADYFTNLSAHEAFKRRDITINAIGITAIKTKQWYDDPFDGRSDLENNIIRACSDDFARDPIRFFRAIRFSITQNAKIDSSLRMIMHQMDINHTSKFWLQYEAQKSKHCGYFFKECLQYSSFQQFCDNQFSLNLSELNAQIFEIKDFDLFINLLSQCCDVDRFVSYFQLKRKRADHCCELLSLTLLKEPSIDQVARIISLYQELHSWQEFEQYFHAIHPKWSKLISSYNNFQYDLSRVDPKERSRVKLIKFLKGHHD